MARRMSTSERKDHRKYAVDCFNGTWTLLTKKKRTKAEDLEMIHRAHASRYHWGLVGNAQTLAIGEWQISRVYAILRRPEPALFHAKECLRLCRENGIRDFPLAFAYEALARASAVAGRKGDTRRFIDQALRAGETIREADDRELFVRDIETVPGFRAR